MTDITKLAEWMRWVKDRDGDWWDVPPVDPTASLTVIENHLTPTGAVAVLNSSTDLVRHVRKALSDAHYLVPGRACFCTAVRDAAFIWLEAQAGP